MLEAALYIEIKKKKKKQTHFTRKTKNESPGRRGRVPRRIVEQIVDSAPVVPLLHAPEPQLVDSAGEVLKILDKLVPDVEQVIDVPMIFPEDYRIRTFRSSLQEPQMAEQLEAVPVIEHVRVAPGSDAWGLASCVFRSLCSSCACTTLAGETPPAQGRIQILGTGDVSATMPDKFQQSDGASLQFIDRAGYCRFATETGTHSV